MAPSLGELRVHRCRGLDGTAKSSSGTNPAQRKAEATAP